MEKGQLLIAIPTYKHPQYIRYYLQKVLPFAAVHNIDIIIYDSSSDDETAQIVKERRLQGYDNLYYRRFPEDTRPENKLEDIFVNSGYEYVWLCGDGIVINLERDIWIIENEIALRRDIIFFGWRGEASQVTLYQDPVVMLKECFAPLSLWGAAIIKGDLFTREEWHYYNSRYLEHAYQASIFEKFAEQPFEAVQIIHNFRDRNPYKKTSVAMTTGRIIEAFAGLFTRTIELLPEKYNSVKPIAQKAIDQYTGVFSFGHFWTLRSNGNLNFESALKYRKALKKACNTHFIVILLIALCPTRIARDLAIIWGVSM